MGNRGIGCASDDRKTDSRSLRVNRALFRGRISAVFGPVKPILLLAAGLILGCAHKPLVAPSPGAVQGGISRVQSSATTAETQRQEIKRLNREALTKQQRIDNKDIFIDAYKKWKSEHQP